MERWPAWIDDWPALHSCRWSHAVGPAKLRLVHSAHARLALRRPVVGRVASSAVEMRYLQANKNTRVLPLPTAFGLQNIGTDPSLRFLIIVADAHAYAYGEN